jgi:1,4-dihydroxy-2-naphthoate octaprenyltransferase
MSAIGFATQRIEPYLSVSRANFLALPIALIALGAAAASLTGRIDPVRTVLALIGLVSLHVAVNAINEYSDYRRGIDEETEETPFSGGSGTLPAGDLEPRLVLHLSLLAIGVGATIWAYLLYVVGIALVPIVLLGGVTVVGYTDLLFFRRLFRRHTGHSPSDYRKRFGPAPAHRRCSCFGAPVPPGSCPAPTSFRVEGWTGTTPRRR